MMFAAASEPVDDGGAEARVGEDLDQAEELSLTVIATAACSSRSARTPKSSSDPLVDFHVAVFVDLAVALTQCGQAQQPGRN
jgi:hypothetical protein